MTSTELVVVHSTVTLLTALIGSDVIEHNQFVKYNEGWLHIQIEQVVNSPPSLENTTMDVAPPNP